MKILIFAITIFTCSAFGVPACAQEGRQKKTDSKSNSGAQQSVKKIPVEIPITNQIYVQAKINNSEPLWFLLDTGSTWTFLDATKARELNIASEGNRTVETGQVRPISMTFAKNALLEISGAKVPVGPLAVMPIRFKHAPQIVGIIGSDLFKRFVIKIDYLDKTIELFEPRSYKYKGHGETLEMEIMEEIPHVVVSVSRASVNSLPAKLLVDTGAAQTIALYAPFVEQHKLLETTEGTVQIPAGGLGGGSIMRKVRAKTVKIGNVALDGPLIYFTPNRRAAGWRDGILGNGLLNRFNLIVDYSRKQVILEPSERLNTPTDFNSYYFDIVREGAGYKVGDVLQSGMAGEAGLRTGDIIVMVDGKPVSDFSLIQVQQMFTWDGRDRVLSVSRGGQILQLKLQSFRID